MGRILLILENFQSQPKHLTHSTQHSVVYFLKCWKLSGLHKVISDNCSTQTNNVLQGETLAVIYRKKCLRKSTSSFIPFLIFFLFSLISLAIKLYIFIYDKLRIQVYFSSLNIFSKRGVVLYGSCKMQGITIVL